MEAIDYRERRYLSAIEAAKFLGVAVATVHHLVETGQLKAFTSASGQKRFALADLQTLRQRIPTNSNSAGSRQSVSYGGRCSECFNLVVSCLST